MIDKNLILKRIMGIEDKLLVSKILDKAAKAEDIKCRTRSDFFDPHQKSVIEKAMQGDSDIEYTFNGGYTGAERVVIFFCPDFMFDDDMDLPFKVLQIKPNTRDTLTHRDYLGSLMALGIKREKIGDILVRENSCNIIVLDEIADYIKYNLTKVGNAKVGIEVKEADELQVLEPKIKEINATVASLRLDSVASAGFGISRSKIAEYIKGDKVSLNWEVTDSLTKQVKEDDTISIRGKGRVVLESIGRTTKKGRTGVVLKKYI